MKTSRLRRTAGLLGISSVFVLAVVTACSNAGEGERCEFDNGNDDCQNGLICIPASPRSGAPYVVNPNYNNSDRCCPPNQGQATHPACVAGGGTTTEAGSNDATPPLPPPPPPVDGGHDADAASSNDASDASDAPEDG